MWESGDLCHWIEKKRRGRAADFRPYIPSDGTRRRGTRLEEVGRLSEWHVIHPLSLPLSHAIYESPYISASSSSYVRIRRTNGEMETR